VSLTAARENPQVNPDEIEDIFERLEQLEQAGIRRRGYNLSLPTDSRHSHSMASDSSQADLSNA
jgi:hypothetical protein